jgi:hypothetical protein
VRLAQQVQLEQRVLLLQREQLAQLVIQDLQVRLVRLEQLVKQD